MLRRNFFLALMLCLLSLVQAAAQQPQTADKWATLYGQKIHYLDVGSGPAVVLLHGMGGSTANWAGTVPALASQYRVIVPDQIGFGKSDKPLVGYRVGTYVDFLDALLKELKVEKATLVGNSLGGWIALTADVDPNTLYLLNPTTRAGIRQLLPLVMYNKLMASSEAVVDAFFAQRLAAGDGYTINALIESVKRGEDALDGRLGGIKTPTLIVWGKQDGLTPLAWGERFKKEIPGAEMVVFDQCGHAPPIEKASEFNAALLKFLAR
jgi:pimeloyl-ACP methyl ester carboxylesterase